MKEDVLVENKVNENDKEEVKTENDKNIKAKDVKEEEQ